MGIWSSRVGKTRDEHGELLGGEAIEKEVGDHQIETRSGRLPVERIGMDEFNRVSAQSMSQRTRTRTFQHPRTCIYAHESRGWKCAQQFHKAAPISLAEHQHIARRGDFADECRAAALKLAARKQPFHPAVMRRETVEAHFLCSRNHAHPPPCTSTHAGSFSPPDFGRYTPSFSSCPGVLP